jgi:NADH-ubiquinone oxidoreductase chain 3
MINLTHAYQEKDSVFECGFHSFLGQNRTQFSISFFIFGLLFLLFDLEILLVYPYSVSSYTNDVYGLVVMMVFFVLLTLGFIFELGKNALTIDSRQTSSNSGDIPIPHGVGNVVPILGPDTLQSSTRLLGLLDDLFEYVESIPTGRELRAEAGNSVFDVAELVAKKTDELTSLKQQVDKAANSELSQPNVTQALTDRINMIKENAAEFAATGGADLVEGMQAAADFLI